MARLEAKARKGFYPLPARVASMIACKLDVQPGATLLDPCAGEGVAVKQIATQAGFEPAGITACELDAGRSETLARQLPESQVFGNIDFLGAYHHGRVSCVYCNPPFDDELGGGGRIEWQFVDRATSLLVSGGVLVLVLPEDVADDFRTRDLLTTRMQNVQVFRFPDRDRKFGEVAIFATKRDRETSLRSYKRVQAWVKPWGEIDSFPVPNAPDDGLGIRKVGYTDVELEALLAESEPSKLLAPPRNSSLDVLRPPMELRTGHLAMLLASGCMNGLVECGQDTHVVRGHCKKVTKSSEVVEGGEVTTTETEHIELAVKVATLDGRVVNLSDSVKDEGVANDE